jgi:4,4'-diaponeurosporenoate glycosyltransferase
MIWPALLCAVGLPAGFALLRRIPLCPAADRLDTRRISLIVPARNEESNLPRLLGSLQESRLGQFIVVDDHSTDRTGEVASSFGAQVVQAAALPSGWTGKTWACHQGAAAATGDALLFLDADAWFAPGGVERLLTAFSASPDKRVAISLVPWHVLQRPYEQLSLFFQLLMAMGAGGFGWLGKPRLFGQCLLIRRELYQASGGHEGVRQFILENFMLAARVEAAGARVVCRGGKGVLNVRMFPDGFAQMCESWTKAFAAGAAGTAPAILISSIVWMSAMISTLILLVTPMPVGHWFLAAVYLLYVLQLAWMARQLGTYHWLICLAYPVPLIFYFAIFGRSFYRRALGRSVTWRGREL